MIKRIFIFALFCSAFVFAQNNSLSNKFALAESYEHSGNLQKAAKIYAELYQSQPNNNLYFESLNRVYVQLKNYAASVDLIEKEIKRNPKNVNLYGLLGSTYYLMGNDEKAFEVWDEPFKFLGPNPVYYRVIANYAVQRRAFEKAIDLFKRGKEISTDKVIFSYDLAQLYSITMQFKNAAEEYCFILKNNPSQLQTVQAKLLANANKPDALKATIKVVENYRNGDNLSFDYLLARLYTENKSYDKAFDVYLEIDNKQSKQGQELYKYANFLYNEKQYSISKKVFKKIIDLYPDSKFVSLSRLGYAKSLEAELMDEYTKHIPVWKPYFPVVPYQSEKVEQVISAFKDITKLYNHSRTATEALLRIGMIKLYLQNKPVDAKEYFDKIFRETSEPELISEAYEQIGNMALLDGNLEKAERNFAKITILARLNQQKINDAKYKLARVRFYEGNIPASQKLLADILKNLRDNNANDALELSLILNTSKNDSSNLMLFAEAEFLVDQKKFNEAAEKYKLIAENPQAFILHSVASLRLAEMSLASNNYPKSIELFEKVVSEGKKNIYADKALYLLGKIYQFGIDDKTKAIEKYEQLLAEFPSSIYLDDAREQIRKLKEKVI